MLSVNETFYSLQGEGVWTGTPMLFLRFAGCNLRCSWCDQPDSIAEGFKDRQGVEHPLKQAKVTAEHLLHLAAGQRTKHVCLTGGEPTAHKLGDLISMLHGASKMVHMESNGTINAEWVPQVDWLTVSPKLERNPTKKNVQLAKELKFIVDGEFDITWANRIATDTRGALYLQPCNRNDGVDLEQLERTKDLVLSYPQYRLSVQLHKVIGVH